jgi:guanylate kinase
MDLPEILKERFSEKDFNRYSDYIFEIVSNTKSFPKNNLYGSLAILISGPSGSGKDSIVNLLPESFKRIKTCTSRRIRPGEVGNDPYIRLTPDEFKEGIKKGEFLETNFYDGNYYGSKISEIKKIFSEGKIPILRIDPTGAKNVLKIINKKPQTLSGINVLYFYITPSSKSILKKRIFRRDVDIVRDEKEKKEAAQKAMIRIENTLKKDLNLLKYAHFVAINYEGKLNEVANEIVKTFESHLKGK